MPSDLIALLDKPVLLSAVLFVGAIIGATVEQMRSKMRRRAWRRSNRWRQRNKGWGSKVYEFKQKPTLDIAAPKRLDAADQLRVVMEADFAAQPLLNKSEARVFRELDRIVQSCNPGWQVMAQVSLGEILRSKNPEAYSCINAKRVDLLLVDEDCRPRHAVEYQGGAHYQGSAAARDAVKKEALRRAGIAYHEIISGQTTPSELRRLVERLVVRPVAQVTAPQTMCD